MVGQDSAGWPYIRIELEQNRMTNWLITGGCGFIGRSLIAELVKTGVRPGQIRVLDNLSVCTQNDLAMVTPSTQDTHAWRSHGNACDLYVGDIRDRAAVERATEGAGIVVISRPAPASNRLWITRISIARPT